MIDKSLAWAVDLHITSCYKRESYSVEVGQNEFINSKRQAGGL